MKNNLNKKDYYDGYNDNDKLLFNFDGFNINKNKMDFKKFNLTLKQLQKDIYSLPTITLFHGTSLENFEQILEKGILPTNNKNRNSYQSTNGFVYTTPFLYLAKVS